MYSRFVSGVYWLGDVGKEPRNLAFPGPDEECVTVNNARVTPRWNDQN